jgi:ketosteroid isomerase-like protein
MRHLTKGSCSLAVAAVALCLPLLSVAHPIDPASAADPKLQAEIQAFRKQFQSAADRRDAVALRNYFTDDFTHTHTSGKVDGKDARIVSVLAAEPTVEMAPVPEFKLSCFGESVCIARALSPIKRGSDGKWFDVRWTQTYVRTSKGWQIAVSQATGLPATVRDAP